MSEATTTEVIDAHGLEERLRALRGRFDELRGRL